MNITIIDYGAGNLTSIETFLMKRCEEQVDIQQINSLNLSGSDCVVLPGVGNFGEAGKRIQETNIKALLNNFNKQGKPIIGICLGAQLLLEDSEESAQRSRGLGLIKGHCRHLKHHESYSGKIPRVGWANVIDDETNHKHAYYFVHSYYMITSETENTKKTKCAEDNVISSIQSSNILALQFHPEKSGDAGLYLIKKFLKSYA